MPKLLAKYSNFLNSVAHLFGLHVSKYRGQWGATHKFVSENAARAIHRVDGLTGIPWSARLDTYNAVVYASRAVAGDFVECGVWRGGAAIVMAEAMVDSEASDRRLFLYDTFTGMTPPGENDMKVGASSSAATTERYRELDRGDHNEWVYASLEDVRHNLKLSRLPPEQYVLVKGRVEVTIPATAPEQIAVLRLDTDWYESTKHELEHLFPKLSDGGVLIVDDYGRWSGSRQAVDEYFERYEKPIHFFQNSQSGAIVAVKPNDMTVKSTE